MRVESLSLQNFRGIAQMGLHFAPGVNALVGINGAGKSAVLDALAAAIYRKQLDFLEGRFEPEAWVPKREVWYAQDSIKGNDVRIGQPKAVIELKASNENNHAGWEFVAQQQVLLAPPEESMVKMLRPLALQIPCPAAVYYSVQRAVRATALEDSQSEQAIMLQVFDGAMQSSANFSQFFSWFRAREDAENELIRDDPAWRDPAMQAVREAIERFTGFTRLRVRRKPQPYMSLQKQGLEFNVMQLSDGERCLLALVGDLARRLAMWREACPDFNGEAVVLIDEIELHLHPAWQRKVLRQLHQTFPHCQFIVSTHSPLVISELPPQQVFLLKDGEFIGHPAHAFGLDSSEVVRNVMEVDARNPEVHQELQAIEDALEDGEYDQAGQMIEKMQAKTGDIPPLLGARAALASLRAMQEDQT
ncbi:AAA family ATPase [Massilia sp. W12]|uniref:AAA family ATPase n=1 Tax=Massilia sp. W12 TaxID=3126507 RepID=UPI0030D2E451